MSDIEKEYPININKILKRIGCEKKIDKYITRKYGFEINDEYIERDKEIYLTKKSYIMLIILIKTKECNEYRKSISNEIVKNMKKEILEENKIMPISIPISILKIDKKYISKYDNEKVFYIMKLEEEKYIYGISIDIKIIISILKRKYKELIINKMWLVENEMIEKEYKNEMIGILKEEKCERINRYSFKCKNIYELLIKLNSFFMKYQKD